MTPQLQQAIRLLQLSTLDLQQEIQEALDSNPLLEDESQSDFDEIEGNSSEKNSDESSLNSDSTSSDNTSNDIDIDSIPSDLSTPDSVESGQALEQDNLPQDLPIDSTWDEYYSASSAPATSLSGGGGEDDTVYQGETSEDIYSHLMWQLNLTPFSDVDRAIATAIIDSIDEAGYLTTSTDDILESLQDPEIEIDEVECVLKRIHHFDPIGVGARTPQECLLIQLKQFDPATPWLEQATTIIEQHHTLLSNKDYRTLMRLTKLKEEELREVMLLLQSLNPRPGSEISNYDSDYVIPDVSVSKQKGRWVVELNPDSLPKLRVNQQYAALSKGARNSADTQFIRSHMQEAKWFIKSLESRNDTLLKVANCIVQQQQGFFEYGPESMKPMVLNDVAEMVDMHESTISRVTTQKYMHTPRGIYELKYFFSSHVATDSGGECSSTAIRALIKKLVAAENPAKPLSDSKIAQLLAEQGIQVARRTIAKYRESLSIPPSNQRKSLI